MDIKIAKKNLAAKPVAEGFNISKIYCPRKILKKLFICVCTEVNDNRATPSIDTINNVYATIVCKYHFFCNLWHITPIIQMGKYKAILGPIIIKITAKEKILITPVKYHKKPKKYSIEPHNSETKRVCLKIL